jgi:hypothetical protein
MPEGNYDLPTRIPPLPQPLTPAMLAYPSLTAWLARTLPRAEALALSPEEKADRIRARDRQRRERERLARLQPITH